MRWIKYFLTDPEGMRCIVISLGHACSVWSGPCGKHSFGKHLGQVQPTLRRTPTIIKIIKKRIKPTCALFLNFEHALAISAVFNIYLANILARCNPHCAVRIIIKILNNPLQGS